MYEEKCGVEGELYSSCERTYNDFGQVLEEKFHSRQGDIKNSYYNYNENQVLDSCAVTQSRTLKNCREESEYTYKYDIYGVKASANEIKSIIYNPGESAQDYTGEYEHTYYYDASGKYLGYVTESSKSYSVSVGDYSIVPEEEYDADGRLVKKMEDNRSYEYDENGRMILAMRDGLLGDIIYDNSGVRVKEEYRKEKGGEIVMYADCECDGDGNVVRLTKHAVNESYQEEEGAVEEYQYAGGKLFACAYYKGDGTLERTKVYKYTLDGKIENITIYLGDNSVENILTPVYTKIAVYTE